MDLIVNSNDHNILETSIIAAELSDELNNSENITIFAPTDAAFNSLPAGVIEMLLEDTETLASILLYHICPYYIMSPDLSDEMFLPTSLESQLQITINEGYVFVNNAMITVADIADNGVLHVIDALLLLKQ